MSGLAVFGDDCPRVSEDITIDVVTANQQDVDRMCCLVFNRNWHGAIWPMYDFNCDKVMDVFDIITFVDAAFRFEGQFYTRCDE